ncbi:MAG: hypothetical protein Ta2A_26700 [Treponemataceae bacterium]|nr:MAG: hypothetical protein Ta2A_26700 [Treponemataceae bacterium]
MKHIKRLARSALFSSVFVPAIFAASLFAAAVIVTSCMNSHTVPTFLREIDKIGEDKYAPVVSETLYVKHDGDDTMSGHSEVTAVKTLKKAIELGNAANALNVKINIVGTLDLESEYDGNPLSSVSSAYNEAFVIEDTRGSVFTLSGGTLSITEEAGGTDNLCVVYVGEAARVNFHDVQITGNFTEANAYCGIFADTGSDVTVSGNTNVSLVASTTNPAVIVKGGMFGASFSVSGNAHFANNVFLAVGCLINAKSSLQAFPVAKLEFAVPTPPRSLGLLRGTASACRRHNR